MSDPANLIQTIAARWNTSMAEQAVQEIAARFWAGDQQDEALLAAAERMRQVLREQLGRSSVPVEQIRLLEISYRLEQGLGRRDVAVSLAKNLRHLAERKTDAMHQARAAFLLADAWYMGSALPFSIDWSKRGFAEAKPLEQRSQGGRPYRILYAEQEVQLALRLGLQGGMYEQAGRLLADAVKRYEAVGETTGRVAALGVQAQVHMIQGRWTEALEAARQARQVAEGLPNKAAVAGALWAGARAAGRLGDLPTANAWVEEAIQVSRQTDDISNLIAGLFSKGSILLLGGNREEALAVADQAVELGGTWRHEILWRWAILERAWVRLAAGQVDVDELRATAEAFGKFGAGGLEAEAQYALYHAMKAAGQDAQTVYDKAVEQFARLKMNWHLDKAKAGEPLLSNRS